MRGSFTRLPYSRHDNCADEYYNIRCAVEELQFLTEVKKIREPQTQNEKCPERAYSQFASTVFMGCILKNDHPEYNRLLEGFAPLRPRLKNERKK